MLTHDFAAHELRHRVGVVHVRGAVDDAHLDEGVVGGAGHAHAERAEQRALVDRERLSPVAKSLTPSASMRDVAVTGHRHREGHRHVRRAGRARRHRRVRECILDDDAVVARSSSVTTFCGIVRGIRAATARTERDGADDGKGESRSLHLDHGTGYRTRNGAP